MTSENKAANEMSAERISPSLTSEWKKENVKKKKTVNKNDLGTNFIAPDGGWGWLVLVAAGFSNVSDLKVRSFQYCSFENY